MELRNNFYTFIVTIFLLKCCVEGGQITVEIAVLEQEHFTQSSTYNLGSSATLICHAQDAIGSVSYQWSSTSSDFFAYNSTAMFNKKRLLSAADAGIHTCTVTDDHGNTGEASLEMMFSGQMLYAIDRYDQTGTLLANNSIIFHHSSSCSDCQVEFYCFSNSTLSDVGDVLVPYYYDDTIGSGGSGHSEQVAVERLPFSTLHVQVPSVGLGNVGIFTCRLPDTNGNTLDYSIGIYFTTDIAPLAINTSLSGYTDLTEDNTITDLVQIECHTMNSPPTSVIWMRDEDVINAWDDDYETLQIVIDRINSHYRNILILRNIFDIVGYHVYTCEIENSAGFIIHNISIDIQVTPHAMITVTPHTAHEHEIVTLTCEATVHPLKATMQLESYINVQWIAPSGVLLTNENNMLLNSNYQSSTGVLHTLTINGTTYNHAGVYTCEVALNGTHVPLQKSVAKYHLVIQKTVIVYDSEMSLMEVQHDTDDLMCVLNGTAIPQMEWLFLGDDIVSPLLITNSSWDKKVLSCMIMNNCSSLQQQCEESHMYIIKAAVISNVRIEASSSGTLTAGDILTLTCSAISIGPVTLKWIGPGGHTIHSHSHHNNMSLESDGVQLSLSFDPLNTSHGGIYTCIASIGGSSSVQTLEELYLLTVQISLPSLTVTTDSTTIYSGSHLSIECEVSLAEVVDSPVNVDIQWNTTTIRNNRITIIEERISPLLFKSIFFIDPVIFSDAGSYICISNVYPMDDDDHDGVIGTLQVSQQLIIDVSINVQIRVTYNPPSDFTLPSPPYYRPASSVTLTCMALSDVVGPLIYHWSSSCSSCVISGNDSSVISIDVLKSSDAGVHSCTVTDAEGHTGNTSSNMILIGAGMYINDYHHKGAVSNNTAVHRGCVQCPVTLFCYSNSTVAASSNAAAFSYPPNNWDISQQSSSYYNPIAIQRIVPSGISLRYQYTGYQSQTSGIYSCKVPDSHGNEIQFSVGLYFTDVGPPDVYLNTVEYWSGSRPGFLMKLECRSRYSIPSSVHWLNNNHYVVNVIQDSSYYETVEIVDREYTLGSSYFKSILIVKSVIGGLGYHNYTCLMENVFGSNRIDFSFHREVAMIEYPHETLIGDSLRLQCQTIELPSDYTSTVHIEWWGPNRTSLNHENNTVHQEEIQLKGDYVSRALYFDYLRSTLDGVYTCEIKIKYLNEQYTESKEYHLQVSGNMIISGNEVPLVAGSSRSILCRLNSYDIVNMEWFLEGLYTIPLSSSSHSTSVSLYLDASTTGLNETTFVCRATGILGDMYENSTTIHVKDMSVDILVAYEAPPDFDLPSPPYFRPGSSLTLRCVPQGSSQSIQYQWLSISSQSFTHGSTSSEVHDNTLTLYDAGLHTCTITDNDGSRTSHSIQITLYGAGLYVESSRDISSSSIANNTALLWQYRHTISLYCFANSSAASVKIMLPSGVEYSSISHNNYIITAASPSGIRFYTRYYYSSPPTGIYTCRITYHQGKMQEMSFGIYSTPQISTPTVSHLEHRDLTEMNNISGYGMILCNSSHYPPTKITWKRDGLPLNDNGSYEQMQIVINRESSEYMNVLILKSVFDVMRSFVYTCIISNRIGEVSHDIQLTNIVEPTLMIATPVELIYGSQTVLSCRVSVPQKVYSQLVPYMTIVWSTPNLDGSTTAVIQETYYDVDSTTQNLTISSLSEGHNGEYICRVTIHLPNSDEVIISKEVNYIINVNAISLTIEHYSLIIGIPNEVVCRINEPGLFRMEIFYSTQDESMAVANDVNTVSLDIIPDENLNGTNITCLASTEDNIHYENFITITVTELRHDMTVEMSSENAIAGEYFTLTCTVTSDYPTMLSWTYNNGDPVTGSEISTSEMQTEDGLEGILKLEFSSLYTSHGGVYVCQSQLNISSTRNHTSHTILLEVEVAPPIVSVKRISDVPSITQTLRCDVNMIEAIDVPTTISIQWEPPAYIEDNNKLSISDITKVDSTYQSFLTVSDFDFTDSGPYTCLVSVTPLKSSSGGGVSNKTAQNTAIGHLSAGLNVSIIVDYDPPSDFTHPSPPYYRPASSVTLTCVVYDAIGSVQYQWMSSQVESFAHQLSVQHIVRNILTASDAGTHTCTVIDELGNTGSASTDMILIGAGIYVQNSELITNSSVSNNSALLFTSAYCSNCRLSFYCLSNATITDYNASILYGYGRIYSGHSDSYLAVDATSSGIYAYNRYHYRIEGIYTCEIADSNDNIIQLHFGAYSSQHSLTINSIGYTNSIPSTTSDAWAIVHCNTRYYIPTDVTWQKDGQDIDIDGIKYEMFEVITSRGSSSYEISLNINDIVGVGNNPVYTCNVGYVNGITSRSIVVSIPSLQFSLSVEVTPNVTISGYEVALNTNYSLVCTGHITISSSHSIEKLKVKEHSHIEWSNSTGVFLGGENINITDVWNSDTGLLTSTLSFHPLSEGHDQLYTCSMTVDFGTTPLSDISQHRVIFDVAYFQLKFDVISCSKIDTRGFQGINLLEADIKETLTSYINQKCHCGFLTTMIDHGEFNCHNDIITGYRARIVGSSDILPSQNLMKILKIWKSDDGSFIYTGDTRKTRVWVDMLCPIEISSLSAPLCE